MGKHLDPNESTYRARAEGPRNTGPWPRKVLLTVGLVLIGIGAIIAGFAMVKHESPIAMIAQTFVPSPEQVFGKPNLLILVEGLDYDYNDSDVESSLHSRSDIIKAINLDFGTKRVYVLSVPRDMLAVFPDGVKRKINQAQSDGGEKEASKVIAQFLGIPGFDRYAILRIDASKDIINAIGGIDVYVKNSNCLWYKTDCTGGRVDYDDTWGHLHIHFTEGLHHMNGDQAVSYGRFRHDWCSDPCRIKRQDQIMNALVDKLKNDKLNTLLSASNLLGVIHKDIQTNLTQPELISLASFFSGTTHDNVTYNQLPYTADVEMADGDDLVPDEDAKAKMVQDMLVAPPTPQATPDTAMLASIAPASVHVDVRNASGVDGAAKMVAAMLRKQGYIIGYVGNDEQSDLATSEIREHSLITFAGAKVRSSLPGSMQSIPVRTAVVTPNSSAPPSDVTIIVGRDLAAVATGASPASTPGT